jgi:hypothetical protein
VISDLHEKCVDLIFGKSDTEDGAIVLTAEEYIFRFGKFNESGRFISAQQSLALTPGVAMHAAPTPAPTLHVKGKTA